MLHYTNMITCVMRDLVARVSALSFIDLRKVLVFARGGQTSADGPFATCHWVNQPPSDPTHYSWHDRRGRVVKRSEWFVARSPVVQVQGTRVDYLISFSLPRFCDQTLDRSRKNGFYPRALSRDPMIAKLDTIVHELYHIDPGRSGIRRLERADGGYSARSHGPAFYREVARLVCEYLESRPEPEAIEFLRHSSRDLLGRHREVVATAFKAFPSFPQRYFEPLSQQPLPLETESNIAIVPLKTPVRRRHYTDQDLETRRFLGPATAYR